MALEADFPNESSSFADEGTAAHALAALTLEDDKASCRAFLNRVLEIGEGKTWAVDDDMCEEVQKYVDFVRACRTSGLSLAIEQKVDFSQTLGLDPGEGFGTADAVLFGDGVLTVCDLKYGKGVRVDAEENAQLMLYALGAIETFESFMAEPVKTVSLVIHQPRIFNGVSIWHTDRARLDEFARDLATAAIDVKGALRSQVDAETLLASGYLKPGKKTCQWCKAKGVCPAMYEKVQDEIGVQFDDLDKIEENAKRVVSELGTSGDNYLSSAMRAVDLIEDFCRSVRAEVERRLLRGQAVPGYKLVEGKRGNRKWSSEADVEALLKDKFRLPVDDIYDKSVLSPARAEKLLKTQPKRWEQVKALITQSAGKPSVAPAEDDRAEWKPLQFETVEEEAIA